MNYIQILKKGENLPINAWAETHEEGLREEVEAS